MKAAVKPGCRKKWDEDYRGFQQEGKVMSIPWISGLLAFLGMLGVVAVVTLGKAASATILLDASFLCIALAGIFFLGYVVAGLCKDFMRSA
jgi:hypothetical protein